MGHSVEYRVCARRALGIGRAEIPFREFGEIEEIDEETARGIPGAGCTWYPDEQPLSNEAV